MLRKLRVKFVAICMTFVTILLIALFVTAFVSARKNMEQITDGVLQRVMRETPTRNTPDIGLGEVVLPYFTVNIWEYTVYVTGGTYAGLEDTETLNAILSDCLQKDEDEGILPAYSLRYLREDKGLYLRIAFADVSLETAALRRMVISYVMIALVSLLPLLGISILLSRWAVAPVETAWKRQRQFLSDASHELKTPLTVILSNADLLLAHMEQLEQFPPAEILPPSEPFSDVKTLSPAEHPDGESSVKMTAYVDEHSGRRAEERSRRWAENIRSEARRMKSLVEEMLTLARADDAAETVVYSRLSLSDTAADCALAFEPVAFETGKPLRYEIGQDIYVSGNAEKLHRLISILLDNAVKYGAEHGQITLTLEKTDRHARLTVSNPGEPLPPETLRHLFERFYRGDTSRSEQRGFGLGLSIAAAIAKEHKAVLKAESDEQSTRFIFTMPLVR